MRQKQSEIFEQDPDCLICGNRHLYFLENNVVSLVINLLDSSQTL